MGENSKIEWTTHTFNPWRGCTKIAEGCAHCYADAQAKRNPGTLGIWGPNGTRVVASESGWRMPLKWNDHAECLRTFDCNAGDHGDVCPQKNRPRVFCASMADVFEDWQGALTDSSGQRIAFSTYTMQMKGVGRDLDERPLEGWRWATIADVRLRLFALTDSTPNLDWLLLTKRPENIPNMWPLELIDGTAAMYGIRKRANVWLGTSIACRSDLSNIERLRTCRDLSSVLFLSVEPLIEDLGVIDLTGIDWVIVGGESGPHARPMHPDWARSLRDQCQAAGVPFLFKQWGEFAPGALHGDWIGVANDASLLVDDPRLSVVEMSRVGKAAAGRLLDGRTWDQFPKIPPPDLAAVHPDSVGRSSAAQGTESMISFLDGPAVGQTLDLRRLPKLLRVVQSAKGEWDALDQLDDTPHATERLYLYVRCDDLPITRYHLLRSPRKLSGWHWSASYRVAEVQPSDAEMRTTDAWQAWATAWQKGT